MSRRGSVLDDMGDPDAPRGSRPWCVSMKNALLSAIKDLDFDVNLAGGYVRDAKEHRIWEVLGYASFSLFCQKELRIDVDVAEALTRAKRGYLQHVIATDAVGQRNRDN